MTTTAAKARREREVASRAAPLARAIYRWAARLARDEIIRARRDPSAYLRRAAKAAPGDVAALSALLRAFGLRRAVDASAGAVREVRREAEDPALSVAASRLVDFWHRETGDAVDLVRSLADDIRGRVVEAVRGVITEGVEQGQTLGEISRRLATEVSIPEDPRRTEPGRRYVVPWHRAELIARTETVRAENAGRLAGYEATGVRTLEWVAFDDGRSGDRHHERLDGVRVQAGETWRTPLGNRLRYPGDPAAPIRDTANCRCTVRPIRAGASRRPAVQTTPTPAAMRARDLELDRIDDILDEQGIGGS
jgi:hypothetical protein